MSASRGFQHLVTGLPSPLRHGHLLSSKGEGLEELHLRSVLVIGEKSRDLKPAFVFFTKQQKGVWGLRNRRKQSLRQIAPNPVFVSTWVAVNAVKTSKQGLGQIAPNPVSVDFLSLKPLFVVL